MPLLNPLRWSCDFYPKSIYVLYVLICLHWAFPGPLKWSQLGHSKWYYQCVLNSVSKYFIENFCLCVQEDHFKNFLFCCISILFWYEGNNSFIKGVCRVSFLSLLCLKRTLSSSSLPGNETNWFALSFISTMMSYLNTSSVQYVTHCGLETLKFVSQN